MAKAKESTGGRGDSHVGTLAFPIVALVYNAAMLNMLDSLGEYRDLLLFTSVASVMILLGLGAVSWRFLKANPTAGMYYCGVLFFLVPVTQKATEVVLLKLLFGAAAALGGGVGLLYFLVIGIVALRSE